MAPGATGVLPWYVQQIVAGNFRSHNEYVTQLQCILETFIMIDNGDLEYFVFSSSPRQK